MTFKVKPKRMAIVALKQPEPLYEQDFCAWSIHQSSLLRKGDFEHLDLSNLAEEIESLSRSDRPALFNHTRNLLLHLLKCQYQPAKHTRSWDKSIREARIQIKILLEESPSLKRELTDIIIRAYDYAREDACDETGLELKKFPKLCPWPCEAIVS